MFTRFFRKAEPPPPPSLEDRIAVLEAGSAELILSTALGGDDEALRAAAIHRLPDGEALRRLAGIPATAGGASTAVSPALERAAQARMAELIDAGSLDFAQFCAQAGHRPAMFAVAGLCKDPGRLPQALATVPDPTQVARLVVEGSSSRLRQLAAESIEDPAQLKQLLKQVRDKDKSVYKILKQKSDALNAAERKAAQITEEIAALCALLERHSRRTYDSFYASGFEQLYARWLSLSARPSPEAQLRAEEAIGRCREVIARQLQEAELRAAERAAQEAALRAAREAREGELRAAQEAASLQAQAEAQLRSEAAAAREAEERERAEKLAAEEQFLRQVGGLIRKANGALAEGNTQRAAGLRRAIEEKLSAMPAARGLPASATISAEPAEPAAPVAPVPLAEPAAPETPAMPTLSALPAYLARQLRQLDDQLHALKQWKDFAVAPKRIELIEEMESLIGAAEEPQILADRIKALQEDWRTISKGIVSDASEDWERFHRASTAAYQPCREYFEAQARRRQENLEKRKAVLGRLTAFAAVQAGDNPDWRMVARVLREAPQEWRRYFPVERDANRAIQGDFDASLGRLQAQLDGWYERNAADKQVLVERARQALAQEDGREAIEAVKRLQMLWKDVGPAARDREQLLWSEFRELCDAVYQKRQQAYAEYAAGLEANKVKAAALCEEAERAASLSGADLLAAAARISEWRDAFDALDEMPRADARGLQNRFERALDLCRAQVARQQARDAEQSFADLFEAGRRVRAYEWAVIQNAEAAGRETLKQSAEAFIESVRHWPKGGLQTIKEALAKADARSHTDSAAHERALRTLCIRCEIQAEIPTPPEDEALRREYQVQRLMRGMGQGSHGDEEDGDALALAWVRVGAVAPAVYESLQARFMHCRAQRQPRGAERGL